MKKVFYGFIIVLTMVIISGCGNKANGLVGTYRMIEMKGDGATYTKSLIDTLGLDFTLEIIDNSKAILKTGNETLELTYDNQKFVSKNNNEEDVFTYTVNGNKITLNYNKEEMTFEKSN